MSIELGWGIRVLTLFVREPTPRGINHEAWKRVSLGLNPYSESETSHSDTEPRSQEFGILEPQRGTQSSGLQT
jgi:hypothetical protein